MIEQIVNGIKYRLNEETLTAAVTRLLEGDSIEDYAGDINIPKIVMFDGVPYCVTSIDGEAFIDCKSLTSITIPDSVTSIGYYAFLGCDLLKQNPIQEIEFDNATYRLLMHNHVAMLLTAKDSEIIDIPAEIPYEGVSYRVVSIDPGAFAGISSLTSITIPNSVTSIGDESFADCDLLKSITISESVTSISNSAFANCYSLTSIVVAEGNTVYDSRENCNAIIEKSTNTLIFGCQKTTIPNSVKRIGDHAFYGCSLTSITIPNSVTSIGKGAFQSCSKLANITIPDSVTTIGESAFKNCESLTFVTIPCSVTSIGEGATFQGCTSLKSVQWNAINCTIDKTSDGHYYPPFHNLSSIKNFTFGNNVKSIPACLCYELSGLTSIVIPDGVTNIGKSSFKGCSSLKAIDVPDSVMIIEAGAFQECKSLKIIALPSNVMIIEDGAFAGCKSWRVIRYGGTVKQCEGRYRYWDQCFHSEIIYCTDGDTQIHW